MGHGAEQDGTPAARLTPDSVAGIAATLQALTAPSRLLLLSQLRQGPATVTELTCAVGMEQSAVSHQLRLLRTMGLVSATRSGRHITYSLYDTHVAALLDEAVYHAEHVRLGAPDASLPVRASDDLARQANDGPSQVHRSETDRSVGGDPVDAGVRRHRR